MQTPVSSAGGIQILTWRGPRPDTADALRPDPRTNPGGGSGMFGNTTSGPMYVYARRWRTSAAPPSVTVLSRRRRGTEQTPLVRCGPRHAKRDARVAAEVLQLPLIRQRRESSLLPSTSTQAAVTCGPPSSSRVTTCATTSLSRSSRAVSGRGVWPSVNATSGRCDRSLCSPADYSPWGVVVISWSAIPPCK